MPILPSPSQSNDTLIQSLLDALTHDENRRGWALGQLKGLGPAAVKAIPALAQILVNDMDAFVGYMDDIYLIVRQTKGPDFAARLLNYIENGGKDLDPFFTGQGGPMRLLEKDIKAVAEDTSYENLARSARVRTHALRLQLAVELAPALNAHIQGMPRGSLEEKKELARWVNEQLEAVGLAVQCPNTHKPARLRGVTRSLADVGRFCYQIYQDGKPIKSAYSDELPELVLMDAAPPKEAEVEWAYSVRAKSGRTGPRR